MRTKVPFPRGPGDWRYDPTTGVMVDVSKAVAIAAPADGSVAELTDEGQGRGAAQIEQVDPDDYEPETAERTATPGDVLPEIPSVRKRAKR